MGQLFPCPATKIDESVGGNTSRTATRHPENTGRDRDAQCMARSRRARSRESAERRRGASRPNETPERKQCSGVKSGLFQPVRCAADNPTTLAAAAVVATRGSSSSSIYSGNTNPDAGDSIASAAIRGTSAAVVGLPFLAPPFGTPTKYRTRYVTTRLPVRSSIGRRRK